MADAYSRSNSTIAVAFLSCLHGLQILWVCWQQLHQRQTLQHIAGKTAHMMSLPSRRSVSCGCSCGYQQPVAAEGTADRPMPTVLHCCRRYLVGSCQLLRSDIVALQAASQLNHSTACRMLLAAPRLAKVPASFWQLLMQYILFLVPQWRQQVSQKLPICNLMYHCLTAAVHRLALPLHQQAHALHLTAAHAIDCQQE